MSRLITLGVFLIVGVELLVLIVQDRRFAGYFKRTDN